MEVSGVYTLCILKWKNDIKDEWSQASSKENNQCWTVATDVWANKPALHIKWRRVWGLTLAKWRHT